MTTTNFTYSLKDPQKARQALVDLFHALAGDSVDLPNPTERPVTLELDGLRLDVQGNDVEVSTDATLLKEWPAEDELVTAVEEQRLMLRIGPRPKKQQRRRRR